MRPGPATVHVRRPWSPLTDRRPPQRWGPVAYAVRAVFCGPETADPGATAAHTLPTFQTPYDRRQPSAVRSWVRSIYLYLAALIGLALITVGGVRLVDLGLRSWVFTQADREETMHMFQPPMPFALERVERLGTSDVELSAQERTLVRQWLTDYQRWQERQQQVDPVVSRRQRTAASSLALILIGLPLYLYHWTLIRGEGRARGSPA